MMPSVSASSISYNPAGPSLALLGPGRRPTSRAPIRSADSEMSVIITATVYSPLPTELSHQASHARADRGRSGDVHGDVAAADYEDFLPMVNL